MKAKLVNKSTIVLLDGAYRYTLKKIGSAKDAFRVKKEKLDIDEDEEIFDEVEDDEEDKEEKEEEDE